MIYNSFIGTVFCLSKTYYDMKENVTEREQSIKHILFSLKDDGMKLQMMKYLAMQQLKKLVKMWNK